MNLKAVHVVLLVLGALALSSHSIAQSMPEYASVAHLVGSLCASLSATLGIVSPSALAGVPVVPADQVKP